MIQPQGGNCSATRWRDADDLCTIFVPAEMFVPVLLAWVEQGSLPTSLRVNRVSLSAFEFIAATAGKPQVLFDGLPTRSPWEEMLKLHRHAR